MKNKNLFPIGEIAKYAGITRKIILNYETKELIKPDKRDGVTGNRYYTIDTFTHIKTIRTFQKLGLSLDEIREYFNNTTDLYPLIRKLENMRDELNLSIEKLPERANTSKIFRLCMQSQFFTTVLMKIFPLQEKDFCHLQKKII